MTNTKAKAMMIDKFIEEFGYLTIDADALTNLDNEDGNPLLNEIAALKNALEAANAAVKKAKKMNK